MANIKGLYLRGNVWHYNYQVAGVRQFGSLHTGELATAIERFKEIRANPHDGSGETVAAMIESFTAHKIKENKFTESTRRSAIVSLNNLAAYCTRLPIDSITTGHMQGWFNKLRESTTESTAQTHLNRARSFFRWCKAKGLTRYNPSQDVSVGRLPTRGMDRFCTTSERDTLIKAAKLNPTLQFILYCGFYAGMRKGEITEARHDWFDLKAGMLHIRKTETFLPKGKDERSLPIATPFLKFLKNFKIGQPFAIEPNVTHGASLIRYDFRRPFYMHRTACGLPWVTPHTMRHTFASLLASEGVSIYKIALWLGDDVRTVQKHYAKLLPGDRDINALH